MAMLVLQGIWAVVLVVALLVGAILLVWRFPDQFGMFLWTRRTRRDDED